MQQNPQRLLALSHVCLVALTSLFTGCALYNPQFPSDTTRAQTLRHAHFNSTSLAKTATKRCAIIISGVRVQPIKDDASEATSIAFSPGGGPDSIIVGGLAAAIDQRGYFLTAAHMTANPPLNLVFYDGDRLRVGPARVVAKIEKQSGAKLDVAIIHVDAMVPDVFEWADTTHLHRHESLFEVGSTTSLPCATNLIVDPAYFAGSLRHLFKRSPGGFVFKSNLPTRGGDSGGPVVATNGQLLAVLSGTKGNFLRDNDSFAVRPDLDWVRASIAADLQTTRESPAESITDEVDSADPVRLTIRMNSSQTTLTH